MDIKAKLHEWLDGAYYVGIVENAADVIRNPEHNKSLNIHWIDLGAHNGSWFADPFILKADENTITLLVEEYEYCTCRGILSEILVDRKNYKLLNIQTILRLDTHLSFPYIIKNKDLVYIMPENCQGNEVAIYSFDNCGMLQHDKVLLEGKYVDTQVFCINNKWYAFAVKIDKEGPDATKRLYVYEADSLNDDFQEVQCINNIRKEERGAGLIFEFNGHILRPAQVCEGGYGKGVILYEIKKEKGVFAETEYARFMANPAQKNGLCFHTFSVYDNLIAVDGFDHKHRWLGKINPFIYKIKNIINKIVYR